jgi:hypothetical protein
MGSPEEVIRDLGDSACRPVAAAIASNPFQLRSTIPIRAFAARQTASGEDGPDYHRQKIATDAVYAQLCSRPPENLVGRAPGFIKTVPAGTPANAEFEDEREAGTGRYAGRR